jgi:hypothetical protein
MFATERFLHDLEQRLDHALVTGVEDLSPLAVEVAVLQLERCKAKTAALEARLLRRFEGDGRWALVGALKPQAHLATKQRVPSKTFDRPCSVARRLAHLPALEAALAAGEISTAHRDKVLAVDNPRIHEALVRDEATIIDWARTMRWKDFDHALTEWLTEQDQDGPEPDTTEGNRADWSRTYQDRWRIDADLDAIGGAIWAAEADRLERLEFEADWREATERLGREPTANELRRTPKQRRAAALIAMARRSATGPEDHRRGSILLSIFTGPDWFRRLAELDNGTPVRPGQLMPWLDDITFETFLTDTEHRQVSVSAQRTYRGALRRFVLGRDAECFHPYCDEPAARCQTDHRTPHSKAGPTSAANGQPACPGHNRAKGNKDPTELEDGP